MKSTLKILCVLIAIACFVHFTRKSFRNSESTYGKFINSTYNFNELKVTCTNSNYDLYWVSDMDSVPLLIHSKPTNESFGNAYGQNRFVLKKGKVKMSEAVFFNADRKMSFDFKINLCKTEDWLHIQNKSIEVVYIPGSSE